MSDKQFIKFLGTAGARFVMAKQLRYSAGTFIRMESQNILLDPGPGTLLRCAQCRPQIDLEHLDAVILTHTHVDHSTDVNAIIDAMTRGGFRRRGVLFAPGECLEGKNRVVLHYLREYLDNIVRLKAEQTYEIGRLPFTTSVRHDHSAETYGIQFNADVGTVSFLVDTGYFDGLVENYRHSEVLILNVVRHRPHHKYDLKHLNVSEAERIIDAVQPSLAVITHFGMTMVNDHPWEIAEKMSDRLGCRVIAASDGKYIDLSELGGE